MHSSEKHKEALDALVVLYNAKAINTDNETMRAAYETVEKALQAASWQPTIEQKAALKSFRENVQPEGKYSGYFNVRLLAWEIDAINSLFTAAPVDGGR